MVLVRLLGKMRTIIQAKIDAPFEFVSTVGQRYQQVDVELPPDTVETWPIDRNIPDLDAKALEHRW